MNLTIYHHPSCSKSRKTLEIIREHGIEPRIVEYLRTAPDKATILKLAGLLGLSVDGLVRKDEAEYRTDQEKLEGSDNAALAAWLAGHPKALQRPIVVDEKRNAAVIGRPPEAVLDMLSQAERNGPPNRPPIGPRLRQ